MCARRTNESGPHASPWAFQGTSQRLKANGYVIDGHRPGLPLWFETLPGNSNDKANVHDYIAKFESFKKGIALADEFLWVPDSALYCKGKLKKALILWLTRIPQTKGNAKMLANLPDKKIKWDALSNGYKGVIYDSLEPGERWALFYSKQAYKKELATLKRRTSRDL